MKKIFNLKIIKVLGVAAILPALLTATVVTHHMASPADKKNEIISKVNQSALTTAANEQNLNSDDSSVAALDSQSTSNKVENNKNVSTVSATSSSTPSNNSTEIGSSNLAYAPPTASLKATCDEAMKSSYTNLYNSKVVSEQTAWSNQVSAWSSEARSRNMVHSGYVQSMVDQYKPAYDARLAQLATQHSQNLELINCST